MIGDNLIMSHKPCEGNLAITEVCMAWSDQLAAAAGNATERRAWLAIGIPTVPRTTGVDYLSPTLESLLEDLPLDASDPLYGNVRVLVMNNRPGNHSIFYKACTLACATLLGLANCLFEIIPYQYASFSHSTRECCSGAWPVRDALTCGYFGVFRCM